MIRPPAAFFLSDFLREVYVPSRIGLAEETVRQMEITIGLLEAWAGQRLTLADLSEDRLRQFLARLPGRAARRTR